MSAATAPASTPSPIPVSDRFTVVPKIREVCGAGLPAALIPTYAALADYANNTTGLCWPEMKTLSWLLKKSVRTVQRHVHKLEELGLVEIVERRRRPDGTFLGYLFRLPHIVRAAERIRERKRANEEAYEKKKREQEEARERKRRCRLAHRRERDASRLSTASSLEPARRRTSTDLKRGQQRLFDETPISGEEGARRRREGYEHLFGDAPSLPYPIATDGFPHKLPSSKEPEVFPAASTGHSRPLAPIYATSRNNHFPPNPPKGDPTEHREEAMHRTQEPPPHHQRPAPPDHLTTAERAWLSVRGALLETHPDLDPRQLSVHSVALHGTTLGVLLRDAPIVSYADPLNPRRIGSTAEQARSRYGEELSRLWRELSGDPHALIDLSPAS